MRLIAVGATRVEGEAPDAAGSHAAPAAAAVQASTATHRVLLFEGVPAAGQLGRGELLVIASIEAANGGGALHCVSTGDAVATVDDGATTLAGVPLLGKATALEAAVPLLATVDGWRVGVAVVVGVLVRILVVLTLLQVRVGGAVGGRVVHDGSCCGWQGSLPGVHHLYLGPRPQATPYRFSWGEQRRIAGRRLRGRVRRRSAVTKWPPIPCC